MPVKCLDTVEESGYHFSDLLNGINSVNTASYKMLPEIVWDPMPSKLCSDHKMLSVVLPFQQNK